MITKPFDLQKYNTFGFASKATAGTMIYSVEELRQAISHAHNHKLSLMIIGGGSNMVVSEQLNALAVIIRIPGIELIKEDQNHVWIKVGAGVEWDSLVQTSVNNGWYGLENLSIIPGTVGACPIQNVGAYGVEIKDFFHELHALEIDGLKEKTFSHQDCHFQYRDSIFKNDYRDKYVILSVTFRLNKVAQLNLSDKNLRKELSHLPDEAITPQLLRAAVIAIRTRRLPNVNHMGNAGSFFMNPMIEKSHFEAIYQKYPDLVHTKLDDNRYKLSAAWMIDKCGWKGFKENNVGVYDVNALVLVNHGHGTVQALLNLCGKIQQSVYEHFGVLLKMEPRYYE